MKIAYGISSLGLGHATRSIPLIVGLKNDGHQIDILSHGRSLIFLKKTLGSLFNYYDVGDIDFKGVMDENGFSTNKLVVKTPKLALKIFKQHNLFMELNNKKKYDAVISDNRFDIFIKEKPSFFIHHYIKQLSNRSNQNKIFELFFKLLLKRFTFLVVPDSSKNSIIAPFHTGFHYLNSERIKKIGIVSMMEKKKIKEDVDLFFSISGPEPQRSVFERIVFSQIESFQGKVVVTLGKPEISSVKKTKNSIIYSHLFHDQQEEMMNRAKIVVCRSGYSTIMDLCELGKKALLIPTVGQPEQEQLAEHLHKMGFFYSTRLENVEFIKEIKIAQSFPGKPMVNATKESVNCFKDFFHHETLKYFGT